MLLAAADPALHSIALGVFRIAASAKTFSSEKSLLVLSFAFSFGLKECLSIITCPQEAAALATALLPGVIVFKPLKFRLTSGCQLRLISLWAF